ncbi:hypothetical protein ACLVWU_05645 [Bdellovibrio sp. HCB290]|uniref:hypothetical protein n=1 Tax=Bdellovibrio sp. HCB290 TaxID=3394356 RepID=UPI0039B4AC2C
MKITTMFLAVSVSLFGMAAHANYDVLNPNDSVLCSGPDNSFVTLNAKHTKVKFEIEGMTNGPQKVVSVQNDGQTTATFTTEEGTLILSNKGDYWLNDGDLIEDAWDLDCK